MSRREVHEEQTAAFRCAIDHRSASDRCGTAVGQAVERPGGTAPAIASTRAANGQLTASDLAFVKSDSRPVRSAPAKVEIGRPVYEKQSVVYPQNLITDVAYAPVGGLIGVDTNGAGSPYSSHMARSVSLWLAHWYRCHGGRWLTGRDIP
ncbi:hypothetical protein ACFXJO_25275 [Streptomyces lavendulae]|uniref:hypothetical protein n=1 Tax=Streptomyces lavendulae TaxID=1914 RepID=UPI003694FC29